MYSVPAHKPSPAQLRLFTPSKQQVTVWENHDYSIYPPFWTCLEPASETLKNHSQYLKGFASLPNWDLSYFLFLLSTILIHLEQ